MGCMEDDRVHRVMLELMTMITNYERILQCCSVVGTVSILTNILKLLTDVTV